MLRDISTIELLNQLILHFVIIQFSMAVICQWIGGSSFILTASVATVTITRCVIRPAIGYGHRGGGVDPHRLHRLVGSSDSSLSW